ncbi:hypothetical protein AWH63_10695 [Marinobacter sp. C18]|uniref:hypothetical protein n=1 Tax=Marinobacter sp. C18 TaxID=1772288 RepID=UPI000948E404|nr:hypothetical protein [Marinobacter sp. C18]OLF81999.1 hypothetical protein AWH63_10695 [Marinobacter sp. C18]
MKLHLVEQTTKYGTGPIIWAHKSQRATLGNFVSVMGVLPFFFLLMFPYAIFFQIALVNLVLDIYRTRKRAYRWADITRRFRFVMNAGYWRVETKNRLRQRKWAWDHFKGVRH